jgi:hypothetical protein
MEKQIIFRKTKLKLFFFFKNKKTQKNSFKKNIRQPKTLTTDIMLMNFVAKKKKHKNCFFEKKKRK